MMLTTTCLDLETSQSAMVFGMLPPNSCHLPQCLWRYRYWLHLVWWHRHVSNVSLSILSTEQLRLKSLRRVHGRCLWYRLRLMKSQQSIVPTLKWVFGLQSALWQSWIYVLCSAQVQHRLACVLDMGLSPTCPAVESHVCSLLVCRTSYHSLLLGCDFPSLFALKRSVVHPPLELTGSLKCVPPAGQRCVRCCVNLRLGLRNQSVIGRLFTCVEVLVSSMFWPRFVVLISHVNLQVNC